MKTAMAIMVTCAFLAGCKRQIEKEFVSGCRSAGTPSGICSCIYDKLEDRLEAAKKDQSILKSEDFQKAYFESIKACVPK